MVGGNDIKAITINILTRTLTNNVAAQYSWLGGKKSLYFPIYVYGKLYCVRKISFISIKDINIYRM
jgi:hypothetical protein